MDSNELSIAADSLRFIKRNADCQWGLCDKIQSPHPKVGVLKRVTMHCLNERLIVVGGE